MIAPRCVLVVAVLAFMLPVGVLAVHAQGVNTGALNGVVTDDTGGVLPGVTVTATSPALLGAQSAVTGPQGNYRFPSLPPGVYSLAFELPGFATVVRDKLQVTIGFAGTVSVQMVLAGYQETVAVSGASPVVDTQNTTVQNTFNSEVLASIPNARDLWSVIAEAPGMTVTRFDVGGSTIGTQTGYSAYGTSGQNRVQFDGVNTTEGTSSAGAYYDYGSMDEIAFGVANASDAQMPTPGVFINTLLKSGGNQVRGDLFLDYENRQLQGENIDEDLRLLGVGRGTQLDRYLDFNPTIGGPIMKDKLWYFLSFRNHEASSTVTGWPPEDPGSIASVTRLQNATYKFTYQHNPANKFTHFFVFTRKLMPYRDAGPLRTLDAAWYQQSFSWTSKMQWERIFSNSLMLNTHLSTFSYNWPDQGLTPGGDKAPFDVTQRGYRQYDQYTGMISGAYLSRHSNRRRYQAEAVVNWFKDDWLGANHSIKIGWLTEWEAILNERSGYRDHIRSIFRSTDGVSFSTPYRIELYNDPVNYDDALWHNGAFVQNQITLSPRLTLNLGVRWDYYSSYEPEQQVRESRFRDFFYGGAALMTSNGPFSLERAPFADAWTVPARKGILAYKAAIAPRSGLSWTLDREGRTVVKANFGRFYHNPAADTTASTNPLTHATATFGWIDRNGDRLFSLDELGPFVSLSGGATSTVQEGINHPFTDEASVFLERQLISNFGARAGFVYRKQNNNWDLIDSGRPNDLWTVSRTVTDPGVDGVVGTSDDGSFTAYNMSTVTVSKVERQAPEDNDSVYKSLEVTLNKRMSDRWSLMATGMYTWVNSLYFGSPQNPNEALNNRSDSTLWTFKLFGTYEAPAGIRPSFMLRHQSGTAIPRQVNVSTNAGTFAMLVEPVGSYRTDNVTILDLRAEKTFAVWGGSRKVVLTFDLFNVANSNAAQNMEQISGTRSIVVDGQTRQVQRFLYPTTIIPPRIAKIGVRFQF